MAIEAMPATRLMRLAADAMDAMSCELECWGVFEEEFDPDDFDEGVFFSSRADWPRFRSGCRHEIAFLDLRDELRKLGMWL